MFGFFKRRKENKLMSDAVEIIGKAFILDGYNSDEATKIALVSIDLLLKDIGEIDGSPWVVAVRGMYIFHLALSKDNSDNDDGDKQLIRSLKENIKLSMNNAKSKANDIDLLILDSINRSIDKEIDD
jgi:hypothetical protein